MATIIEKLMITLGLDASGVEKGAEKSKKKTKEAGEEAEKAGKKMQGFGKSSSDAFIAVNKSAAAFLATLGGTVAIKNFIRDTTESTASLGRFSQNIGSSVSTVSAWGQAAEVAGGSASGLQGTLAMLSRSQTELALTGNTGALPYFAALGISLSNINGKARPTTDILLDLSKAFQGMDRTMAFNFGQMLGIDEGTMNLLLRGPQAVKQMVEERRRSTAVTEAEAQKAQALNEQWTKVKQQFQDIGRELTITLSPALMDLAKSFADLARQAGPPLAATLQALVDLNKETDGAVVKAGIALLAFRALGGGAVLSGLFKVAQAMTAIGAAAAGAAGGGVAALGSRLAPLLRAAGGLGLLAYSEGLNSGEDERMAQMRQQYGQSQVGTTYGKVTAPVSSPTHFFSELEKKHGLPSGMLDRMWQVESGRGKNMISPKGATGHFQFMPGTAADMGLSREDTFDLQKSASGAARYMGMLIKRYGSVEKALAAYNFGMGNVDRNRPQPLETRNYVAQIAPYVGSARSSGGGGTSVTVGTLTVNTQATDAQGIANDIVNSLDFAFASQADYGVTP